MFAPPEIIATEVFAEVPASLHRRATTGWTETNRAGVATPSFLEGPSFDRDGNLYLVDIPHGRVFRVAPSGHFDVVAEYDGEPNGLKIHRDGRIFIADYKNGLMRLDPASGAVTPVLERRRSERFKGLNDLFFGANGDLYFTDQGETGLHDPTGRVYRLTPEGRLDCLVATVPKSRTGWSWTCKRRRCSSPRPAAIASGGCPTPGRRTAPRSVCSSSFPAVPAGRMDWRSTPPAISPSPITGSVASGCFRRTANRSTASIHVEAD